MLSEKNTDDISGTNDDERRPEQSKAGYIEGKKCQET